MLNRIFTPIIARSFTVATLLLLVVLAAPSPAQAAPQNKESAEKPALIPESAIVRAALIAGGSATLRAAAARDSDVIMDLVYRRGQGNTTASQTAWGIMGMIAAGETGHPAVAKAVNFLLETQKEEGSWWDREFTGTGFPEHFFLKYHMYQKHFPLMALAQYRNASA